MMDLKECETKEKVIRDFFVWLFEKEDIKLISNIDLSLAPFYNDPNIYYPSEINSFFNTKAMQRLGKISQLGLQISENENCYHNRLEHSKGTYNRKLEELIYQLQDEGYRRYIEENNLKMYLIAELIKEAGHDIGHLPLSHIMEIKVIGRRDFHEEIGKRILLEDKEIQEVLKNINADLPIVLQDVLTNDILNSKAHDESNYDVDRLDYLGRDSLYLGRKIELTNEQYSILYAKVDSQGNIVKDSDGSIILANKDDEDKKRIDVYEYESKKNIEAFLEERIQAYKNVYFSEIIQIRDSSVGNFVNQLLNSKEEIASDLKKFLQNMKSKNVEDVDIEEYLKWNDFKFYKKCIEVARKSKDENLREFATMIIPPIDSLMNFTYSNLELHNIQNNGLSNYTEEELEFLREIKQLIRGKDELSENVKNKNFFFSNCKWTKEPESIEFLKKKWGDKINFSDATVYGYKKNHPIYIKDESGKVFILNEHPQKIL